MVEYIHSKICGPRLRVFDRRLAGQPESIRQQRYEQITIGLPPGEHFVQVTTTHANSQNVAPATPGNQSVQGSKTAAAAAALGWLDMQCVSSIAFTTSSGRQFGPYRAAAAGSAKSNPFGRMADKAPYLKALGGFQVVPATQRVAPVWVFVPSQLCGINVVSCIADTQARQRAAGAALHELQQVLTAAAGVVLAAVGPNGSGAADAEVLLSSASCSAQVTAASELARLQAKLSGLLQQAGLEQDKAAAAAAALRSSGSSNAGDLQQTRDAALASSLATYKQAVQQSEQLQAALQLMLASSSEDQQQQLLQAAGASTQAEAPSAAWAALPVLAAAMCNGSSAAGGTRNSTPAGAPAAPGTLQQQSIQAAFGLLQAAEAEYVSHVQSLQADCNEVQQLLAALHSRLRSLTANSQWAQKLAGDVCGCSAALQEQLAACHDEAAAAAPLHQQQHVELLAKQQRARALQQLRIGAGQQLVEVRQVKLCLEKVQDEIEDLEYALKKAAKKHPAKVPVLQQKLAAAQQELAALQAKLKQCSSC